MAAKDITYEALLREVKSGVLKQVYVLMGNEPFFIDQLLQTIIDTALPEDERDFCLNTFYGGETTTNAVINAARSFSMGSRMVVVVRNANELKDIDELALYLQNAHDDNILILVNKAGTFDRRKKFMTQAAKIGVIFESQKLRDKYVAPYISSFFREKGYSIDTKSVSLFAETAGNDLTTLYAQMNKLVAAMPEDEKQITPELIEEHVGISKDYNMFEFQDALVARDSFKAFRILNYFDSHEKDFPPEKILPQLFTFFSRLMIAYYAPNGGVESLAQYLNLQDWQVRNNVLPALHTFSRSKVLSILECIRNADEMSKGLGGSSCSRSDVMKQLVFFILH